MVIQYVGGKTQWFMKKKSRKEKDTFVNFSHFPQKRINEDSL